MQRKYDLVANMYLNLYEKQEKYQNHIRALSSSSCVIDDKQPEPPSRIVNRRNRYIELQKKFYQLGVENSKAISSLSAYSKYKNNNPRIVEPQSNKNCNQPTKIDWMKPYCSSPLPPLKSNPSLFKKNCNNDRFPQTEDDKNSNIYSTKGESNKVSKQEFKKKNDFNNKNTSNEATTINSVKSNTKKKNVAQKELNENNSDDKILYLTEPKAKDPEESNEDQKNGTIENTVVSISNKILNNENNEKNETGNDDNFENDENLIEDDFEDEKNENDALEEDKNELDDFEDENVDKKQNKEAVNNDSEKNNNNDEHEGAIENKMKSASNLLLDNSKDSNEDEFARNESETDDLKLEHSESSKEDMEKKSNSNQKQSQTETNNDHDEFENFELE